MLENIRRREASKKMGKHATMVSTESRHASADALYLTLVLDIYPEESGGETTIH